MLKITTTRKWRQFAHALPQLQRSEAGIAGALQFIKTIEEGDLHAPYPDTDAAAADTPHQRLANSLQRMREQMQRVAEQEKQRTWISSGLARFAEILRAQTSEPASLYDTLIAELVRYLGINQGGLFIVTERTGERCLELAACYAYNRKKYLAKTIAIGEGLLGQCYLERERVYLTDVPDNYLNITSGLGQANPKSLLLVPLKRNDTVAGIVELASLHPFEAHQIEFVEKLAESIAATVEGMQTSQHTHTLLRMAQEQAEQLKSQEEEMRQGLEELAATQDEMRRREAETQNVLQALQTITDTFATAEFDMEGRVLTANDQFLRLFEYSADDIKNKNHRQFATAEQTAGEDYARFWQQLADGHTYTGEVQRRTRSGRTVWLRVSYAPVRGGDGRYYKIIALGQDATEARQTADEARRLSLVADNTDNSVVITDAQGGIEYVNQGFVRMTGYTLSEVKGRKPGSFLQGPLTDPLTVKRIREKLAAREPFYDEILNYGKDGNTYWISLAINPVLSKAGVLENFISIQTDVTETKRQALDYRCKLEAIDRAYGVVEFDTQGNVQEANENFLHLMGYSLAEVKGRHHSLFVSEYERESEGYQQFWHNLGQKGAPMKGEFQRRAKDGSVVWLQGSYSPILDLEGKPYKVVKYAMDITAQKVQENAIQQQTEELRSQEEELRQNLEELAATQEELSRQFAQGEDLKREMQAREQVFNLTTILSEADPYGNITFVNDKLCEVSQYSREELIGQPHNIFRHPDMPREVFRMLWQTIKKGQVFRGVVKNRRKDGTHYWVDATLSPVLDEAGRPIKKGQVFRGVVKNRRKDGTHYWVDATLSPVLDEAGRPIKYIGVRYVIPDDALAERLFEESLRQLAITPA